MVFFHSCIAEVTETVVTSKLHHIWPCGKSLSWDMFLAVCCIMLIRQLQLDLLCLLCPVFQVTHSFEISNGVSMRLVVHLLSPQTFSGKVQRCAGTKTIINRGRAVVRSALTLCVALARHRFSSIILSIIVHSSERTSEYEYAYSTLSMTTYYDCLCVFILILAYFFLPFLY